MENLTKRNAERTSIALVEDDDTIRELIEINLKSENYQVDSFFSIEQLEKNYKPGLYDLLILDIMLPDIDGWQILKSLRHAGHQTPVLFLTARDGVEVPDFDGLRRAVLAEIARRPD